MMQIHAIAAFNDNYFWLIQPDDHKSGAFIVDPGAAQPVFAALQQKGLSLQGILITHHHHDHIDGAAELQQAFKVPIYGPDSPRIPQVTHVVAEGNKLKLGRLTASIMALPGHTLDHIAYYFDPVDNTKLAIQPPILFSADTLFGAGCGRLFDGTAALLFASLQRIATLPDHTLIYASHEYTLANIRFALTVEPENQALIERQKQEQQKRDAGLATVPTNLLLEKQTNPFLRCHNDSVKKHAEALAGHNLSTAEDVFTCLRKAKDKF